jgi:transposase
VAFLDEFGHTFRARVGTTWAPKGKPPILKRVSQRREVSSIAALTAPLDGPARLYTRHFRGSVHGDQVVVALRHVRRRIGRPLIVVIDRLSAHRAKVVQDFIAAHREDYAIEWLPPYAPELNPVELCNGAVKHELLNARPGSIDDLRQQARRSFLRLGRRPDLLSGFFRHAGLDVT